MALKSIGRKLFTSFGRSGLFTYGVTGSGKTYNMIGNQKETVILQRFLDTVYKRISFQKAKKYVINKFEFLIKNISVHLKFSFLN